MSRMLAAIAGLVFLSTCAAQTASDLLKRDYHKRLEAELVETGQRHVDLGWGIRNSGLIPQCTYQLVLAVELSWTTPRHPDRLASRVPCGPTFQGRRCTWTRRARRRGSSGNTMAK